MLKRREAGNPAVAANFSDLPYWNWKLPVCSTLVEGDHASQQTQRECAQLLINACSHLIRAKPSSRSDLRITCVISLPDMFSSELCIYIDEDYFLGHTTPSKDDLGEVTHLSNRSLASEWGLHLPNGVLEHGIHVNYPESKASEGLDCDRWYFGEVAA